MTELEKVCELLNTNRYDSKDWTSGNIVDRVEWLIGMYESKKEEVENIEKRVANLEIEVESLQTHNCTWCGKIIENEREMHVQCAKDFLNEMHRKK